MMRARKLLCVLSTCGLLLVAVGCGGGATTVIGGGSGGGGTTPPPTATNVAPVVVDSGPAGATSEAFNVPYVSVTVCAPASSNCQTIDHIQVDTGSSGLRIISSVLQPTLLAAMPQYMDLQNRPITECMVWGDGYSWGSVRLADAKIAGEVASNIPVQVIGDPGFTLVPSGCQSSGTAEDTVPAFGANGILGISVFQQDCGPQCTVAAQSMYYACPNTGCLQTAVALTSQIPNPVFTFPIDNNGTVLQFPSVPTAGAATVTGSLIFGIGTESNNELGSATVLTVDPNAGTLTVLFNGQTLSDSFIDSGSNGIFFPDSALATCPGNGPAPTSFYCPSVAASFSVTVESSNSVMKSVAVAIANVDSLVTSNPSFTAFSNVGGTNMAGSFDLGMPFFYGKTVFNAIEGESTAAGNGPFVAF